MSFSLLIETCWSPRLIFAAVYAIVVLAMGVLAIVHAFHPFEFKKNGLGVVFTPPAFVPDPNAFEEWFKKPYLERLTGHVLAVVPVEEHPLSDEDNPYLGANF